MEEDRFAFLFSEGCVRVPEDQAELIRRMCFPSRYKTPPPPSPSAGPSDPPSKVPASTSTSTSAAFPFNFCIRENREDLIEYFLTKILRGSDDDDLLDYLATHTLSWYDEEAAADSGVGWIPIHDERKRQNPPIAEHSPVDPVVIPDSEESEPRSSSRKRSMDDGIGMEIRIKSVSPPPASPPPTRSMTEERAAAPQSRSDPRKGKGFAGF